MRFCNGPRPPFPPGRLVYRESPRSGYNAWLGMRGGPSWPGFLSIPCLPAKASREIGPSGNRSPIQPSYSRSIEDTRNEQVARSGFPGRCRGARRLRQEGGCSPRSRPGACRRSRAGPGCGPDRRCRLGRRWRRFGCRWCRGWCRFGRRRCRAGRRFGRCRCRFEVIARAPSRVPVPAMRKAALGRPFSCASAARAVGTAGGGARGQRSAVTAGPRAGAR